MTGIEWVYIASSFFAGVLIPTVTILASYRKMVGELALQKKKQEDDKDRQEAEEELKRLELMAEQPEREAKAADMFVSTSKNLVETLRKELEAQASAYEVNRTRYVQEIQGLRNEIMKMDEGMGQERASFRKEIQILKNENTDLKITGSDLAKGIDLLTEQLRKHNEPPVYKKKKETGPLLSYKE